MNDAATENLRRIVAAFKAGDFTAALAACREVLKSPAGAADARVLFLAADAARRVASVPEWVDLYRRAVTANPTNAEAHYGLGAGLRITGDGDAARANFEKALALDPGHAAARYQLAQFSRFQPGDPEIAVLRARFAAAEATLAERIWIGFALAKALEETGEHAAAFETLAAANALKRAKIDYDVGRDEAFAERLRQVFTPALVASLIGVDTGHDPGLGAGEVFVVGMPRSGTTLAEQIIAAHPRAAGLGEVLELEGAVNAFAARRGRAFPECLAGASPASLAALGHDYAARVAGLAPGVQVRVNKTPANFLYVGAIALALPAARIVHCRRDPLYTCFSCYATLFEAAPWFAYDLGDLARYHNLYAAIMAHWRTLFPGRMLELDYETLVADQARATRRLIEFCGLAWDDACLNFHQARRSVATASNLQVRRPLYKGSVGRAKPFTAELAPLAARLTKQIRP